jgi:hypothetical protein
MDVMVMLVSMKHAMDMNSLIRRVLTFIFEPNILSVDEIVEMRKSLLAWSQKIKLDREMERVVEEEEFHLTRLSQLLQMDMAGEFDDRKKIIKMYGVNWRKTYREIFPESVNPKEMVKAQEMKEEYDKKHAQQEGLV